MRTTGSSTTTSTTPPIGPFAHSAPPRPSTRNNLSLFPSHHRTARPPRRLARSHGVAFIDIAEPSIMRPDAARGMRDSQSATEDCARPTSARLRCQAPSLDPAFAPAMPAAPCPVSPVPARRRALLPRQRPRRHVGNAPPRPACHPSPFARRQRRPPPAKLPRLTLRHYRWRHLQPWARGGGQAPCRRPPLPTRQYRSSDDAALVAIWLQQLRKQIPLQLRQGMPQRPHGERPEGNVSVREHDREPAAKGAVCSKCPPLCVNKSLCLKYYTSFVLACSTKLHTTDS